MFIFLTPFEVDWERIFVFFHNFFCSYQLLSGLFLFTSLIFFNDFIFSVLFAVPQYF